MAIVDRLAQLREAGVSVWLDTLSRELLWGRLECRGAAGGTVDGLASVASFFVSRVDTKAVAPEAARS